MLDGEAVKNHRIGRTQSVQMRQGSRYCHPSRNRHRPGRFEGVLGLVHHQFEMKVPTRSGLQPAASKAANLDGRMLVGLQYSSVRILRELPAVGNHIYLRCSLQVMGKDYLLPSGPSTRMLSHSHIVDLTTTGKCYLIIT